MDALEGSRKNANRAMDSLKEEIIAGRAKKQKENMASPRLPSAGGASGEGRTGDRERNSGERGEGSTGIPRRGQGIHFLFDEGTDRLFETDRSPRQKPNPPGPAAMKWLSSMPGSSDVDVVAGPGTRAW